MVQSLAYPTVKDLIVPYSQLNPQDICLGADPFVFKSKNQWYLLLQSDPQAIGGISGYTLRTASSIPLLVNSLPVSLKISSQPNNLKQVWAAEIHNNKYLYVAISDGDNKSHRMHVYKTKGDYLGSWYHLGLLKIPKEDDCWAIDLTFFTISNGGKEKTYAVWSGWQCPNDEFPQHIFIAQMLSPTRIGKRHLIASPVGAWSNSIAPLLEGPQSLFLNGEFKGLLVSGNASWTEKYNTSILKYNQGNPLDSASWKMSPKPLFKEGYGIGHGVIVEDNNNIYFIGHRKTSRKSGWQDRTVFYTKLDKEELKNYLDF